MSIGICALGMDVVYAYFRAMGDITMISVGSGNGVAEKMIEGATKRKIVCVDPDPFDFIDVPENMRNEICVLPMYPRIEEYLLANPSMMRECALFINWPRPGIVGGGAGYDIAAIASAQPKYVIIICETSGTAGSQSLLQWLGRCGVPFNMISHDDNVIAPDMPPYILSGTYTVLSKDQFGFNTYIRIVALNRIDVEPLHLPDDAINDVHDTSEAVKDDCVIA